MKLNNPMKFFPQMAGDLNFEKSRFRSTILTRGDIIKKFAKTDSLNEEDWHLEQEIDDKWFKMSFDGGNSFPLKFNIKDNTDSISAIGVPSPTYIGFISAIPTIYDETYNTCNMLDNSISSIETITRLEDINKLSLKVVSRDPYVSGNVVLNFKCGTSEFSQTISVTTNEIWQDIIFDGRLSGIMTITRDFENINDTLKEKQVVIPCIITNIKIGVR